MRLRTLLASLALVWLAACAALGPRTTVPDFDVLARVFVGQDGPSFSSNLRWTHMAGEDRIWLMTPLGQTLAYIEDTRMGATLTSADQQRYQAGSVEELTRRALGWALPLEQLRYWIRGQVVPGLPTQDVQRASDGSFLELTQGGWRITFTSAPGANPLPRRLQLTQGRQQIRLVIDEWRDPGSAPSPL